MEEFESLFGGKQQQGIFPCPPQFLEQFPTVDHYLAHSVFVHPKSKEQFILLLTDRSLYKFGMNLHRIWVVDLRDIHSVEEGPTHETFLLTLRAYRGSVLDTKKPGKEEVYADYLQLETVQTDSIMTRDIWMIMLLRVLRISQQKFYENAFIPAPEVYQWSLFCNKINEQGKQQVRLLVSSSNRLFNIEIRPHTLEIIRPVWAFAVANLECVMTFTDNQTLFTMKIAANTPSGLGRSKPMRELVSYVVKDVNERNYIVGDLKRLYRNNTHKATLKHVEQKDSSKMTKGSWLETAHMFINTTVNTMKRN